MVYWFIRGHIYATRMESQDHRELVRANLGARIRSLRMEQRLSQHRFSRMVDIDRTYLIGIEKGRRNPTIDNIVKIADGLDVTLVELFSGIDIEYDPNAYQESLRDSTEKSQDTGTSS